MKRRDLLKQALTAGALLVGDSVKANEKYLEPKAPNDPKRAFRIAHITDVHICEYAEAPMHFSKCLEDIKTRGIDFFLNGGDTVMGADDCGTKIDTLDLWWKLWQECTATISSYEMYSCIGNHDPWCGPGPKHGKEYVVQQLQMPGRYYSFNKKNWHFIVLDSMGAGGGKLDDEQRRWLEKDFACLPADTPVLVMSHYPILSLTAVYVGGNHVDAEYITDLFYKHRDKKIHCINGHIHLVDECTYNGVQYFNNGAVCGYWWVDGDSKFGNDYYQETPPGYAILDLYEDGTMTNKYYPHRYR